MKRNLPLKDPAVRAHIRQALNRVIDGETVVQDSQPANETGKKGVGNMVVWNDAGTRKWCVQIDGTYYGVALTAL